MTALEVYAILKKKIESAATGIVDIYKEDGYIVFVMEDGTKFRIEDSTKDIIDIDIDDENYIIVTYEDGATTKSDNPIMEGIVICHTFEGKTEYSAQWLTKNDEEAITPDWDTFYFVTDLLKIFKWNGSKYVVAHNDYVDLVNKPSIEGHTLSGAMTLEDIGDTAITVEDIIDAVDTAFTA